MTLPSGVSREDYVASVDAWHAHRVSQLTASDGWLTLVARYPLQPGANHLPIGTFTLVDSAVVVAIAPDVVASCNGEPIRDGVLHPTGNSGAAPIQVGDQVWEVVARDSGWAVRVRDPGSVERRDFRGISRFPVDPEWRVEGHFHPHVPPRPMEVVTWAGPEPRLSPGAFVFTFHGGEHRLDVLHELAPPRLYVLFGDPTNGRSTYGAGRYLYAPMPAAGGQVFVDFNRACTPPCAFSPYVVCPLPPPENRLPFPVTAGEITAG